MPSTRPSAGQHCWWPVTLIPTWYLRKGITVGRISLRIWQPLASKTWSHTSSRASKPGSRTGGHGACTGRKGRCGPRWTIFSEQTTICSITYLYGNPGTTPTITWYLCDFSSPPIENTPATWVVLKAPPDPPVDANPGLPVVCRPATGNFQAPLEREMIERVDFRGDVSPL